MASILEVDENHGTNFKVCARFGAQFRIRLLLPSTFCARYLKPRLRIKATVSKNPYRIIFFEYAFLRRLAGIGMFVETYVHYGINRTNLSRSIQYQLTAC